MSFLTWLKDTFERAATTAVQVFLVVYIGGMMADPINSADGGHQLVNIGWAKSAVIAVIAAVYTVLKQSLIQSPYFSAKWQDYLFRIGSTFVVTAGAAVTADGFNVWNIDGWQVAAMSGVLAVFALVKGWLSDKMVKGTITPLSLAKAA